jgi:tetratricopeptide (TPR) repeat protein
MTRRPMARPRGRAVRLAACLRQSGLALALVLSAGAPAAAAEPAGEAATPPEPSPSASRPVSGDERVVALNEEGSALYAAADYRHAAERFLQAYAIEQDPNLLFNIASCYEGLADVDAALEKYRAFLSAPGADPEGRPRAEGAIARLLAEREPVEPQRPADPVTKAPAPPPPVRPREPAPQDPAWLPWVGLGGGAALGVLGASFYWMGVSDHDQVTSAAGYGEPNSVAAMTRSRANDLVQSGNTKKAMGVTTASVGGALVAGYFVWWLLDPLAEPAGVAHLDVSMNAAGAKVSIAGQF